MTSLTVDFMFIFKGKKVAMHSGVFNFFCLDAELQNVYVLNCHLSDINAML